MRNIFIMTILLISALGSLSFAEVNNYNDPNVSKEVNALRKFRDHHLKKNAAGRAFIKYYYRFGPVAAKAIRGVDDEEAVKNDGSKRYRLRILIRLCLLPLMYAGKNFDAVMFILKSFIIFLAGVLIYYVYIKIKASSKGNKRIEFTY